jgi:hypothetical protein
MPQSLLDRPILSRLRRNHALEHATIHLLSARQPRTTLVGRSDPRGYFLFGDVSGEAVAEAAQEALARLRAGEQQLAIHPNCGTNMLTAGFLGGIAAFAALAGSRNARGRIGRMPLAIVATVAGLVVAQPLGLALQRSVTLGRPLGLRIIG